MPSNTCVDAKLIAANTFDDVLSDLKNFSHSDWQTAEH